MAEQASCCWQCSEYCVNFAELLTTIESLNGEKDYVTEEDIIQKMAVEVNVTGVARSYKIRDTLKYATDASYVSKRKLLNDDIVAFAVNNNITETKCPVCNEVITPFKFNSYPMGVKYVDRGTFEFLARELYDFRIYANKYFSRLDINKTTQNEQSEKVRELKQKVFHLETEKKNLEKEIENKDL